MVVAGKEDFGNNLSNFRKKFLWSRVLTNLGRALLRPRPYGTIIYYSNYNESLLYSIFLLLLPRHTYYLPRLPTIVVYICNIHHNIYMYIYVYVCMYCAMMYCMYNSNNNNNKCGVVVCTIYTYTQ